MKIYKSDLKKTTNRKDIKSEIVIQFKHYRFSFRSIRNPTPNKFHRLEFAWVKLTPKAMKYSIHKNKRVGFISIPLNIYTIRYTRKWKFKLIRIH